VKLRSVKVFHLERFSKKGRGLPRKGDGRGNKKMDQKDLEASPENAISLEKGVNTGRGPLIFGDKKIVQGKGKNRGILHMHNYRNAGGVESAPPTGGGNGSQKKARKQNLRQNKKKIRRNNRGKDDRGPF